MEVIYLGTHNSSRMAFDDRLGWRNICWKGH